MGGIQALTGLCRWESHFAAGPKGSELTEQRFHYACDRAVILTVPDSPGHVLIEFEQGGSNKGSVAAFGGTRRGDTVEVADVYFHPGEATPAKKGTCVFSHPSKMVFISCIAVAEENGRRSKSVVAFKDGVPTTP